MTTLPPLTFLSRRNTALLERPQSLQNGQPRSVAFSGAFQQDVVNDTVVFGNKLETPEKEGHPEFVLETRKRLGFHPQKKPLTLGEHLNVLMKKQNVSPFALAKKSGVPMAYISNNVAGTSRLTPNEMNEIAKVLDGVASGDDLLKIQKQRELWEAITPDNPVIQF